MATYTDAIVFDAMCAKLAALTLSTPLPVAYPNIDFEPAANGYLRVSYLPNSVDQVTLGDLGKNRHLGIFQVSVMWPENTGSLEPIDIAGEIVAEFKRGTVVTASGLSIRIIQPPEIGPKLQETPYSQYPVTIRYQVDDSNPS